MARWQADEILVTIPAPSEIDTNTPTSIPFAAVLVRDEKVNCFTELWDSVASGLAMESLVPSLLILTAHMAFGHEGTCVHD